MEDTETDQNVVEKFFSKDPIIYNAEIGKIKTTLTLQNKPDG